MTPCAGDPRFTSDDPFDRAEAAKVCGGCPAADACLAGALARGETWGVYGGQDVSDFGLAEPVTWELPAIPAPEHNRARYTSGCRCAVCTESNRQFIAHWREEHRFAAPEVREPMPEQLDLLELVAVTTERRL